MIEKIKVLIAASEIPDSSIVIKKTGEYKYIFTRYLKLYGLSKHHCTINAPTGYGFLVCRRTGNASVVKLDTELLWVTDINSLLFHLREEEMA